LEAEMGSSGTLVRSYVWGADLSGSPQGAGGVGGLVETRYYGTATTNAFAAFDGNGNVSALVNAADGTVVANYEYGPFGEVIRNSGPMAKNNPLRFSTKYQDDESDLVYYGHRFYKPTTGNWLGRDSAGEDIGGMNLYGFLANNSVGCVDYLGELLIAVDGTDSSIWIDGQHRNSFIKNFANSYRQGGGTAHYYPGPHTLGGNSEKTMLAVYDAVSQALQANEHEEIDMVGHSRGGAIVIWAAWTLLHDPPMSPCGRKLGANIHFMGLYDAVNMYLWVSTDRIPPNVGYVAHARRDPADGSRSSWGNTGTSGGQHYTEKFFWCTHSGMGGDPWGGDHPSQMTEQQDKENSPKVDAWIRNNARQQGVTGI
jgi:RHS repeat-associated protein